MSEPDDLDDDLSLGAMRSVWREMRDEEPPARGMAELLAAARAQVAPKPEPAWKRAFASFAAAFRRPPVLALATVVVLVGTGLLVGRRTSDDADTAKVHVAPSAGVKNEPGAKAPDTLEEKQKADEAEDGDKTIADKDAAKGDGHRETARPTDPEPPKAKNTIAAPSGNSAPAVPANRPSHHAAPAPERIDSDDGRAAGSAANGIGGGGTAGLVQPTETPTPTQAPPPPPPPPPIQTEGRTGEDVPTAATPPADAPDTSKADHAARPSVDATTTDAKTPPDLVAQCKAAAARGDCPTTRKLAGQVAKQNAPAYKAMSRDANVAKCLQ